MDLTPYAPNKFTGNFKENASEWLEKFELYCDATDTASDKIYQVFPLFLDEYAFTWYRGLESEIKQNKGELFKKFLRKYGATNGDRHEQFGRFTNRRQQPGEPVTDFINDLNEAASGLNLPKQAMIDHLTVHCLPEHMRRVIIQDDPNEPVDVEYRLRVSEVCERIGKGDNRTQPTTTSRGTETSADGPEIAKHETIANCEESRGDEMKNSQTISARPNSQIVHGQRDRKQRLPKNFKTPCFRCGKCDHIPSQCRYIGVKCRKCTKIGHLKKMCKKKNSAKLQTKQHFNVSAKNDKTNKVKVRVGHVSVSALVDSGADITAMSSNLFKRAKLHQNYTILPTTLPVKGVTGTHLRILGKSTIPIHIGGLTMYQQFLITENIGHDLILGVDFLKQQKSQIDFDCNVLKLQKGMVEVPFCGSDEKYVCLISLAENVTLPPRSETVLNVHAKTGLNIQDKIGLIEMNPALYSSHSVLGASCLVHMQKNVAVARILNPTNSKVRLTKDTTVGKMFEISNITSEMSESVANVATVEPCKQAIDPAKDVQIAKDLGIDFSKSDVAGGREARLLKLIRENRDIFSTCPTDLGCTDLFPHAIDTGDAQPIRQRAFRANPTAKAEISRQIKQQLENDIIEPSVSEWASPVVLVRKKSGEMRFTIDYRKLNAVTRPKNFPLPTMEDIFDTLGESNATVFSTLDMQSGYWQQKLDQASAHKSAFICHEGLFQYKRVPFGLQGSPGAFMRVMTEVLRDLNWKTALVYMDDILIFSRTFEDHLTHLQEVFGKLREANLKLNPRKCKFAAKEVKYLGHVLSKDGIAVDTSKTDAVRTFPRPRNATEVRAFLGLANYYRRFVNGFADVAAPLNRLVSKNVKFQWDDACDDAFQELKKRLTSPPILAFPDFNKQFILYTDASGFAISYILGQKDEKGRETVVAYGGRALRASEKNWSITDRECLALVEGIKHFRVYLASKRFQVYTDHSALTFVKKLKEVETQGRHARWAIALQGYQMDINHKKGAKLSNADGLSRREYPSVNGINGTKDKSQSNKMSQTESDILQDFNPLASLAEITEVTAEELKQQQRDDPDFADIIRYIEDRELPDDQNVRRRVTTEAQDYVLDDGVLHHLYYPKGRGHRVDRLVKQLAVPHTMRDDVLKSYHDSLLGGHQGKDRTYQTIRYKYFWPNMYSDITIYIRTCLECQRAKQDNHKHPAPLRPLPIGDVFSRVHLDIMGPLKTSADGYKHVLVISCAFSKWIEIYPLKTITAIEVADLFYRNFICRYGAPDKILTDRGQQFMSKVLQEICNIFQITKLKTSSYRPQTNATVERANSSILAKLRAYIKDDQSNWPELLAPIMFAMYTSISTESTQYSPYFLLYGKEVRTPLDTALTHTQIQGANAQEYIDNVHREMHRAREIAGRNMEDAQNKYKTQHDKRASEPEFRVQDRVWIDNRKKTVGLTPKLCNKWLGPFYVTRDCGNNTYRVRRCADHMEMKSAIHADRMKLYHTPELRPTNTEHEDDENDASDSENEQSSDDENDDAQGDARERHNDDANQSQVQQNNAQRQGDDNAQNDAQDAGVDADDASDSESDTDTSDEESDDEPVYIIEKILRHKYIRGVRHYRIKWAGFSAKHNSWEPERNFPKELIRAYKSRVKKRRGHN